MQDTRQNVIAHNRDAWDKLAREANEWTVPVSPADIDAARRGDWRIYLTQEKPAPRHWFPADLRGLDVLCLASGGGQQGPILAATGASVTVFDNSAEQLRRDRFVAHRDGLPIRTVQGDMRDLSAFAGASFDLIFHPVSNIFVPEVRPVWRECYRVLRPGGILMMGTVNPIEYIFDREVLDNEGKLVVRFSLPFSEAADLTPEERARAVGADSPVEFSHTLEDQIGGQLDAGFVITGFFEARRPDQPTAHYFPSYIATRAVKPG